jgi:outer membrane protein OmpA-like peptidoglycan-associated protein
VTKQGKSGWHVPVGLEAPVNSEKDDFGILTDRFANEGYFSSNRGKTVDIYHFKSNKFHFWFPETQKDNQYCFTASDSGSIQVDTLRLQYVWDFGDGSKMNGPRATHCYQSPGPYSINLYILDRGTGKVFFNKIKYEIEITNIDQPYINSPDIAIKGETVELDGLQSNCPGYTITGYYWEFGDGTYSFGERANHIYHESGNYEVRLGLMLKSKADGGIMKRVVSRKIRVLTVVQESASNLSGMNAKQNISDISRNENIKVKGLYSSEAEIQKESEFQVVILSAPTKVPAPGTLFRKVPSKYSVKEVFDEESGYYSYVVDQQLELMFTYPAYSEMISAGYNDTRVRLHELKDQAEKELHNLKVKYGVLSDSYFDTGNKLVTNGILMLNQIATLMAKYPHISIEIGVHTDNQGNTAGSQWLSQTRAQTMVDYLVGTGMDGKRLRASGYGGTKPVVPNTYPTDRRLNRRIEFIISYKK